MIINALYVYGFLLIAQNLVKNGLSYDFSFNYNEPCGTRKCPYTQYCSTSKTGVCIERSQDGDNCLYNKHCHSGHCH